MIEWDVSGDRELPVTLLRLLVRRVVEWVL